MSFNMRLFLFAATCLSAGPVFAQAGSVVGAQSDGAVEAIDPGADIIVTARKRNERLLDVPASISALPAAQIERYAISSLSSISQQVPQLVIGEAATQTGAAINLRGVGAGTSNASTEQSVTLNLDGIQVGYGNAIRLGQFDLQRVEVLKGPQALFYGKNSPAGIISLISNDPGNELEARVRSGYGFNLGQKFIEAIVSSPLTETLGVRAVGYYSKQDGWFRNSGVALAGVTPGRGAKSDNLEEKFARLSFVYRSPASGFSAKLKVNYGERERDGAGPISQVQISQCPFGVSQFGNNSDCRIDRNFTEVTVLPATAALHPNFGNGVPHQRSKQFLASLTVDYDVTDDVKVSSVSGYYRVRDKSFDIFTGFNNPAIAAASDLKNRSFSQEVRVQSNYDGPLNFLVGGFYQDGRFSILNPLAITLATSTLSPVNYYQQDTRAYSFFGQVRYKLVPELELAGGARLSRERKTLTGTLNDTPISVISPTRRFRDLSPEFTATYKPYRDLTLYASYREGFTSGGFNTSPTVLRSPATPAGALRDLSFEQITVKGGETGIKGYAAGRQLRFDASIYYFKFSELQLTAFDPIAVSQTTRNAGGAKVRGVEISTVLKPDTVQGLELRMSAGYNKATYTEFLGGCYAGQTIAAGCNLVPRNPALATATFGTAANPYTSQDQRGQDLVRAPRWSLNGGFTYEQEIGSSLGASISVDASYSSSYIAMLEASPTGREPGYWELAANFSLYGGTARDWELALIGKNLTNNLRGVITTQVPLTGAGTGTATGRRADLFSTVNSPRSILLQLTIRSSVLQR